MHLQFSFAAVTDKSFALLEMSAKTWYLWCEVMKTAFQLSKLGTVALLHPYAANAEKNLP